MKNNKQKIFNYSFKKDKKGFLLGEETLKIIIAVIGIGFLIFLLISLYLNFSGSQKQKEALASIDLISNEINRISSGGEVNPEGILVPNPSGWDIFGFVGGKKPNSCSGENCVCICKKIWVNVFDRQIKECDSKGNCLPAPDINIIQEIKIENDGTWISVKKVNEFIEIAKK